jgi:molecular chaperone GrpE
MKQEKTNTKTHDLDSKKNYSNEELYEEVEEQKKLINDLEIQNAELIELSKRIQADFSNYRKVVEREKEQFRVFANENILKSLLSVLDSFELAIKHHNDVDVKNDLTVIYTQLIEVLEEYGLKKIDVGDEFNPKFHEAIKVTKKEDLDVIQRIGEVFQQGFILGQKVLRPAKVEVLKKEN